MLRPYGDVIDTHWTGAYQEGIQLKIVSIDDEDKHGSKTFELSLGGILLSEQSGTPVQIMMDHAMVDGNEVDFDELWGKKLMLEANLINKSRPKQLDVSNQS